MKCSTVTLVGLHTFDEKRQKPVKSLKANIHHEERNVVRNLHFLCDIDSESFGGLNTLLLSEPDDQVYVMRKGNKADYVVAMRSELGDSQVDEDHLPPTDGNVVLLVDAMAFIHGSRTPGVRSSSIWQLIICISY